MFQNTVLFFQKCIQYFGFGLGLVECMHGAKAQQLVVHDHRGISKISNKITNIHFILANFANL